MSTTASPNLLQEGGGLGFSFLFKGRKKKTHYCYLPQESQGVLPEINLSFDQATNVISGRPTAVKQVKLKVIAKNPYGETSDYITINAYDPYIPEISQSSLVKSSFKANVSYKLPCSNCLPAQSEYWHISDIVWSVEGLPDGVSFNPETLTFTGYTATAGLYQVKMSCSTNHGTALANFKWRVGEDPFKPTLEAYTVRNQNFPNETSSSWWANEYGTSISSFIVPGTNITKQAPTDENPEGTEIIRWYATNLPNGVSISEKTGYISGNLWDSSKAATVYVETNHGTASALVTFNIWSADPEIRVSLGDGAYTYEETNTKRTYKEVHSGSRITGYTSYNGYTGSYKNVDHPYASFWLYMIGYPAGGTWTLSNPKKRIVSYKPNINATPVDLYYSEGRYIEGRASKYSPNSYSRISPKSHGFSGSNEGRYHSRCDLNISGSDYNNTGSAADTHFTTSWYPTLTYTVNGKSVSHTITWGLQLYYYYKLSTKEKKACNNKTSIIAYEENY